MSVTEAKVARWRAEAEEKITVETRGAVAEVKVCGFEVARYMTWGSLITKATRDAQAEAFAAQLRAAYVEFVKENYA